VDGLTLHPGLPPPPGGGGNTTWASRCVAEGGASMVEDVMVEDVVVQFGAALEAVAGNTQQTANTRA